MHVEDFISRTKSLINKLTSQGFEIRKLRRTFEKFYELLFKYELHLNFNRISVGSYITVSYLFEFWAIWLGVGYRVSPRTVLTSTITTSFNFEPKVRLSHHRF